MDSHDLLAFAQVYKERSINKAAKALFMSPQGLGKLITRLESELERSLFVRTHNGVIPTKYGEVLQEKAVKMGLLFDTIKSDVQATDTGQLYELRVPSTCGFVSYIHRIFFDDFEAENPCFTASMVEVTDKEVLELLEQDNAELGFVLGPYDTLKYTGSLFTRHQPCVVLNKDHPLASQKAVTYGDIAPGPLALKGRSFNSYHLIMNQFLKAGLKPHVMLETTEIEVVHKAAARGTCIGISEDYEACDNPFPNTVILPFADSSFVYDIYMITKKNKLLSLVTKTFQNFALEWIRTHQQDLFHWDRSKVDGSRR